MEQAGARVSSPMTLLREYTTAVRDLLHGRTVDVEGRYVRLSDVTLDWPPAPPPPVIVGGRGPKTVRLAGEIGDGVLLDAGFALDKVRDVFATAAEGRTAAGRADPFDNVVFVELDPASVDLAAQMDESIATLSGIGADTVVFHGAEPSFDPEPLIAAWEKRGT
jgi:alkanesulfonate monooxygenase SsuD/methylene tetrahydromethanopterin reductase-like flavin-dependent oxidoreductase (luciferase family)